MPEEKEKTNIEKLCSILFKDANIKPFLTGYAEKYELSPTFMSLSKKCFHQGEDNLDFFLLIMYAEMYCLHFRDEMLAYILNYSRLTAEGCCGIINAIRKRRKEKTGFSESTAAALLDNLQREGRLLQYSYRYGEKMLDPKAANCLVVPYRAEMGWGKFEPMTINVALQADGYLFPKVMNLQKEGNEGIWKLRDILTPEGGEIAFPDFLDLVRDNDEESRWGESIIPSIALLKANGIMDADEVLIRALAEVKDLKKMNPDAVTRIRKNLIWWTDQYVLKAGFVAGAVLGAFEDDEAVREEALAFMDSITDSFPTVIYVRHYDGDSEIRDILKRYESSYITYVPAGNLRVGNILVPRYGSREAREKIMQAPWFVRRLPAEGDQKIWLQALRLPGEVVRKEIYEVRNAEIRTLSAELLRILYMPKDAPDHYEVNREAFRGKEGQKALNDLKTLLWSRGDLNSDLLDSAEFHAIFDALKAEYEPDFARFLMNHYQEIRVDQNVRAMLPQIQENWGIIQYYRTLNPRKFKDLPAWKMSFNDIFRIMAETRFDRRQFEDSRYDEAETLSARFGYHQKGFEKACHIQDKMLKRKYSSIPDVSGKVGAFSYRMLALDDISAAFFGQMLDCCQMLGGAGESCMLHSCTSDNGRVFLITDKHNRPVAGSWVWRNGSTICFDNVEGIWPAAEKAVIAIYKEAAEKLVGAVRADDAIRKVTFGGGYSDISTDGFAADDENPFPIEKVSYISDSRQQYILYMNESVPMCRGQDNTPAVYENQKKDHLQLDTGGALKEETYLDNYTQIEMNGGYRKQHLGYEFSEDALFREMEVGSFSEIMEKYFGDMDAVVREEKQRIKEETKKRRKKKRQ